MVREKYRKSSPIREKMKYRPQKSSISNNEGQILAKKKNKSQVQTTGHHGKKPSRIFQDKEDEALNSLNKSLIERFNNTNQYLHYDIEADMNKIHKKSIDKGQFKELSYNHQVIGFKMKHSSASESPSEKVEKVR